MFPGGPRLSRGGPTLVVISAADRAEPWIEAKDGLRGPARAICHCQFRGIETKLLGEIIAGSFAQASGCGGSPALMHDES